MSKFLIEFQTALIWNFDTDTELGYQTEMWYSDMELRYGTWVRSKFYQVFTGSDDYVHAHSKISIYCTITSRYSGGKILNTVSTRVLHDRGGEADVLLGHRLLAEEEVDGHAEAVQKDDDLIHLQRVIGCKSGESNLQK